MGIGPRDGIGPGLPLLAPAAAAVRLPRFTSAMWWSLSSVGYRSRDEDQSLPVAYLQASLVVDQILVRGPGELFPLEPTAGRRPGFHHLHAEVRRAVAWIGRPGFFQVQHAALAIEGVEATPTGLPEPPSDEVPARRDRPGHQLGLLLHGQAVEIDFEVRVEVGDRPRLAASITERVVDREV